MFSSCESTPTYEECFGTYVVRGEKYADTLILYKDLKFYHSITKNGITTIKQNGNIKVYDDVFWFVEYRFGIKDTTGGWDCNGFRKTLSGEIRIVRGGEDQGNYYTKVK